MEATESNRFGQTQKALRWCQGFYDLSRISVEDRGQVFLLTISLPNQGNLTAVFP